MNGVYYTREVKKIFLTYKTIDIIEVLTIYQTIWYVAKCEQFLFIQHKFIFPKFFVQKLMDRIIYDN